MTLDDLHLVLQDVMGWENKHLHAFTVGVTAYAPPMDEPLGEDARRKRLKALKLHPGDQFTYNYDFGDDWDHELPVEDPPAILAGEPYPQCIDGENACPPEDCGGRPGYMDILDALERPDAVEHRERLEWLPVGFKPSAFDPRAVNRILSLLFQ